VAAFNLTASAGGTVDFSGVLSSSVSNMNKVGLGTVRFTSDTGNTYSGRTSVAAGTLLITNTSGSGTGTAVVQVGPAGTFGGSGISGSSITVSAGGKLRAGTGAAAGGSLTLGGDLTLNDGSVIQLVLGNGATHSTLARTGGTWAFDAGQGVDLLGIGVVTPGQTYDNVITNLAADPGVADWQILTPQWAGVFSFDGVNVDLTTTATPEPAALSLLALGATALLRRRRVRAS
jgi:autotransporter-associated beta strand protein